ncbi:MAG: FG-GAP-like repeat-containing protein [Bryobacteraceae bacterium]
MRLWVSLAVVVCAALLLLRGADSDAQLRERILRHRNLGKAFYENPVTQNESVEEFRKALELKPDSPIERLNYGLALLRAGKTDEGIAEIERVQQQDPAIPHTWFNLGIEYKKLGDYERAATQFERMIQLVPDEPISHYNLGTLYKLANRTDDAIRQFEIAARLDPNLAAPHFQLYNAYRQAGRREEAAEQLRIFQAIKKQQEGAAVPEDMEWSFYSEIHDVIDPATSADPGPAPVPKFQTRKLAGRVDPATAGAAVLDYDADGRPDLLVWSKVGIALFRNGLTPVRTPALAALKDVVWIEPADYNNDGYPDLCVITDTGAFLFRNDKGVFQADAAKLPDRRFERAVWVDFDHDYDLDLILLGAESALYRNEGQAGFADHTSAFPFERGLAIDAAVFRLIPDTKGMDLLVSYRDRDGVFYRDRLAGRYTAEPAPALPAGSTQLTPVDLNNDSFMDVAYSRGGSVGLVANRDGKLVAETLSIQAQAFVPADLVNRGIQEIIPAATARADFNGDGRLDLIAFAPDGSIERRLNATPLKQQWIQVRLIGVKNPVLAYGTEVEIRTGGLYQKKLYQGFPLHFGVRDYKEVDSVRITWPNGLIQNEASQPTNKVNEYKEAQRLSGSCPFIWTWNGNDFEYITDVLGVAPLGASAGDGEYFPVDHDEYVQVRGESLVPVNGKYEIRITEELSEVAYIDQVQLIAVDHLREVDIFTNDKWKSPPFPEFRLFGSDRRIYAKAARNHRGEDVRSKLAALDGKYPDDFSRTMSGVAENHSLTLDFGKDAPGEQAVLVLHGWVDWADGSTFLGVSQENRDGLVPPYLQVKDAAGNWVTVIEDMGMPAGKPKTIAVDLSGKFLSDSREIRIVTNLCIYWDEIFLIPNAAEPPARLTTLEVESADLRFRGFSKAIIHPQRKQPEFFIYGEPSPTSMWNPTPGMYTRFGDVRELLTEVDDRFVIMGSGDEMRLLFDAGALPALPAGWRRDFLVKVDGWAKDRDPNTAHGDTVEPLPFHGMSQYPYGPNESFPDTPRHREWREKYNTRPALRLLRPLTARGRSRAAAFGAPPASMARRGDEGDASHRRGAATKPAARRRPNPKGDKGLRPTALASLPPSVPHWFDRLFAPWARKPLPRGPRDFCHGLFSRRLDVSR